MERGGRQAESERQGRDFEIKRRERGMVVREAESAWVVRRWSRVGLTPSVTDFAIWLSVANVYSDFGAPAAPASRCSDRDPAPPARGRELGGSRVFPTGRRGLAPRGGAAATPTGLWAEAILLVAVVVLRGAAPAVAVRAALGGAAVVAGALETERELAGLSVGVAT